ncbi:MAG: amino acid ABC transporter permease [Anaerostipes sp.]|jgi:His/Glu/Gln/Arg/opine family amino acid ABC transporter permease subunit|nr:amino acid ABC transporter permease [Anaerostipes sp.]
MSEFMSDFYKVFIYADRYKMFLEGLRMTLLVSVVAVVLGIVLGLVLAIMKMSAVRKGRRTLLSVIANIYIDIIRGTPTVVQLMIMYFLVFQARAGFWVGVFTFGLNSAAYVAEIIRAGIMAVDQGQMEGGRSLGLSYGQTMKDIIIPQAVKNILPALGNEFIVLVKETAILGYVSIQDLMKAADFVASRTFITFMPLVGCAVVYYVVIKILSLGLNAFERRLRKNDNRS